MKALQLAPWLLLSLVLVACDKKPDAGESAPSKAEPAAEKPPEPEKPVPAAVDLSQVPVEEDFEAEAESEITPANLEQQLDAMEKELQAE